VSVFVLAPKCKFLTETDKSKWPPPQILYRDVTGWSALCKNNKVYFLATEGSEVTGNILLFFIYDLKEGRWYGPEKVGEKIKNEVLLHDKELLKKYEPYEPYYGDYFITYFPEFDVDEEGRAHIFYGGAYEIDEVEIRGVPPPITAKMYLIYARRETDGKWEE
jgi:hypothetical protein